MEFKNLGAPGQSIVGPKGEQGLSGLPGSQGCIYINTLANFITYSSKNEH